jgi:hypothetical protein
MTGLRQSCLIAHGMTIRTKQATQVPLSVSNAVAVPSSALQGCCRGIRTVNGSLVSTGPDGSGTG